MHFPCLVPKSVCTTAATVHIDQEGLNEYGEELTGFDYTGMCNWQESAKRVLTADYKTIELSARAYFRGDPFKDLDTISGGYIIVNGATRRIYRGTKARNVDGSVNYTELEVV